MELRLQQFIAATEQLSDIRNLEEFNPIVFKLEKPLTATQFVVCGAKVEPSYMGIPINTTWVVLDPSSPYYRMALKLRDVQDPETITDIVPTAGLSAWWHVVRTYDEIFADPQYFVGMKGPKGDKGDPGEPGPEGPAADINLLVNRTIVKMVEMAGTLEIIGSNTLQEGGQSQYTVQLTEPVWSVAGNAWETQTRNVDTQVSMSSVADYSLAAIDGSNNMTVVGNLSADTNVNLVAHYPSFGKIVQATKNVLLTKAQLVSITINGANYYNEVFAGNTMQLTCIGTFSDGSTAPVTPVYTVANNTYMNGNGIESLAANLIATVSASGVLSAKHLYDFDRYDRAYITVTATVMSNGTPITARTDVCCREVVLGSGTINVANAVGNALNENVNAQCTDSVIWHGSQGSSTIEGTWSVDNSYATINSTTGLLHTNAVSSSQQVVITRRVNIVGKNPATASLVINKTITINNLVVLPTPKYGVGPALPTNWQTFISGLAYSGTAGTANLEFTLDQVGANVFGYFAYPKSYGLASFFDVISQFTGGWGGAGNSEAGPSAASTTAGTDTPLEVVYNVNGVDTAYYVYRTDFDNLGSAAINHWRVTAG